MKSTLPYPDGYCRECKEHIQENDLFGRYNKVELLCTICTVDLQPTKVIYLIPEEWEVAERKLLQKIIDRGGKLSGDLLEKFNNNNNKQG